MSQTTNYGWSSITFDYPEGTSISTQYQSLGIDFGGSNPFVTEDTGFGGMVLSGTPRFEGSITGTFIDPNTGQSATVPTFTLEAGYFDSVGSTQLRWYDITAVR